MSASQCDKVRLTDLVLANNLGGTTLQCNDQYFSDPVCQRIGGCESRIAGTVGPLGDAAASGKKRRHAKASRRNCWKTVTPPCLVDADQPFAVLGGMCHLIAN